MTKTKQKNVNILDISISLALSIVTVFWLYIYVKILLSGTSFYNSFFLLFLLAILGVVAFSILYVYAIFRRMNIPKLARGIAYFFSLALGVALLLIVYGVYKDSIGIICTGFFGVKQQCIENQNFVVGLTFMNPIAVFIYLVASVLGITELLKARKS